MDTPSPHADIKVNCADGVVYYCKYMLQRIPYYDTLLNGGFADSNTSEINFDYKTDRFEQIIEFIEKGSISGCLFYSVYEFSLIINYDNLKDYIVKNHTVDISFVRIAMRHHHHQMLEKLPTLMRVTNDLSADEWYKCYKYVVKNMPEKTFMFKDITYNLITKKWVQLALEHKDINILNKVPRILNEMELDSRIKFLKNVDVDIIDYAPIFNVLMLWIKANKTDKSKAIDKILKINMHKVECTALIKIMYTFNDDKEDLMKLLNLLWREFNI